MLPLLTSLKDEHSDDEDDRSPACPGQESILKFFQLPCLFVGEDDRRRSVVMVFQNPPNSTVMFQVFGRHQDDLPIQALYREPASLEFGPRKGNRLSIFENDLPPRLADDEFQWPFDFALDQFLLFRNRRNQADPKRRQDQG